jgi:hypothetical protein
MNIRARFSESLPVIMVLLPPQPPPHTLHLTLRPSWPDILAYRLPAARSRGHEARVPPCLRKALSAAMPSCPGLLRL